MAAPLEFVNHHEAWYAGVREVELQCIRPDNVSSYAVFEEHALGVTPTVRLTMWADGWKILADHPSLFARLAARLARSSTDITTLDDITALLTEYGARDVTPRKHPSPPCQTHSAAGTRRPTTPKD